MCMQVGFKATVDDSRGTLLPSGKNSIVFQRNGHPRVDLDHRILNFEAHLEHPGLHGCTMIHQFSEGKLKVSKGLGNKSAVHVH